MSTPLPLGTVIKPYGEIAAVSFRDGERYYMMVSKDGRAVALMPAGDIERWAELSGQLGEKHA